MSWELDERAEYRSNQDDGDLAVDVNYSVTDFTTECTAITVSFCSNENGDCVDQGEPNLTIDQYNLKI